MSAWIRLASTLLLLGASGGAAAQESTGRLTGLVFDSTRNVPLAGAEVVLIGTRYSAVTNDEGRFFIPDLPAGSYAITFRHSHLELIGRTAEALTVQVQAGEARDLVLVLREHTTVPAVSGAPALPPPVVRGGQAVLIGRVVENGSLRPIAGAEVRIAGTGIRNTSDAQGRFVLFGIPGGQRALEVSMIGYQSRSEPVNASAGLTTEITVQLSTQPVALPPIEVTVRSQALERFGYYDRRDDPGSFGHYIERVDLEKRNLISLEEAFQNVPSVVFDYIEPGRRGIRFRRALRPGVGNELAQPFCTPQVHLDGSRLRDDDSFDLSFISILSVEAIEVYVGANAPQPYGNACGAVLIWTRRGS